LYPFVKFP